MEVTIHEAKTHLSRLMRRVEAGEAITVCRGAKPVGKIVPVEQNRKVMRLGAAKHLVPKGYKIPKAFFDPLSEEELKLWQDGEVLPRSTSKSRNKK